ncbi:MAG: HAD-IC family P-type ATPase, partial [Patescibacteria group bacterium]
RQLISSEEIVPGDILCLEAGDKIQADGRIISAAEFTVNEAILTGESEPNEKNAKAIAKETGIGDRANMVYRGTTTVNGRATAIVTATGPETEIGRIASLVKETVEERTPLQYQLARLSKFLSVVVLAITALLFLLGLVVYSGEYSVFELFQTSIAVAVAAIPEGLVISLTVILAIGMQYILKKNALVRKLVAAETLGSVSVICTDKTGTLTEGKMRVTRLITASADLDKDELGLLTVEKEQKYPEALMALRIGVLCNNAIANHAGENHSAEKFFGDTTEIALAEIGERAGLNKHELDDVFPRVAELPFDSRRKFMATLNRFDHDSRLYVKGALGSLLPRASYYEKDGQIEKITAKERKWFSAQEEKMAGEGLRVLAFGYKKMEDVRQPYPQPLSLKKGKGLSSESDLAEEDVNDLILVGLAAMSDPLRSDVKETLALARRAGIKVVMITGDHIKTAQAIGREIGLNCGEDSMLDGTKLSSISDENLKQVIEKVCVFARVDPKDKIRIVKAFRANGEVVAMTGDGVNDAPALKGADVGVALGSGTDVAKEIADLVLLDDKFSTIVHAVEEGRKIYQNIKKVVLYLLAGSIAEVMLIGGSLIAGLPLAVLPAQILWINIIEESFPSMALAFDKGEPGNMADPPRGRNEKLISREMKFMMAIISMISNILLFGLFIYFYNLTGEIERARTLVFLGLGIFPLIYIYSIRSTRLMIWRINPFDNLRLTLAVMLGWVLLIAAIYFAPLQTLLRTVAISWQEWLIMVGFGVLNVVLIESIKAVFLVKRKSEVVLN